MMTVRVQWTIKIGHTRNKQTTNQRDRWACQLRERTPTHRLECEGNELEFKVESSCAMMKTKDTYFHIGCFDADSRRETTLFRILYFETLFIYYLLLLITNTFNIYLLTRPPIFTSNIAIVCQSNFHQNECTTIRNRGKRKGLLLIRT